VRDGSADGSDAGFGDASIGDAAAQFEVDASPGKPDNACSVTAVSAGAYDPDCVYLVGRMGASSDSWTGALILPQHSKDVAFGFGESPMRWGLWIRPTDGSLLFASAPNDRTSGSTLYRFKKSVPTSSSPDSQVASQEVVATACASGTSLSNLFVFPDGAMLYQCLGPAGSNWVVQDSAPPSAQPFGVGNYEIVAVGPGRVVLGVQDGYQFAMWKDGKGTAVLGVSLNALDAARARPGGGFYVVGSMPGVAAGLWEIAPDGSSQMVGQYDLGVYKQVGVYSMLEPSGALITIARNLDTPDRDRVVRFQVNAPPELLYDSANGPVNTHMAMLVSGP
jgi:hypothetical protein